jgi:putative FmdB family regulatory protein
MSSGPSPIARLTDRRNDVPTYQYVCKTCAEPLEVVQSFTDDPLTQCPECPGELRKVFSSVGVVFKGSGFYRNDSRQSSSGKSKAGEKSARDGDGSSGKSEAASSGSKRSEAGSSSKSGAAATGSTGSTSEKASAAS